MGQPREVSRYILIREAAEIWYTSYPVVFKEAALRRSPRRQVVAVKDRLDYLETAWPADGVGSCRGQDMERTALCEQRPGVRLPKKTDLSHVSLDRSAEAT